MTADESPNALERALARAAADEPYRAEFYRVLMESDVYVLGRTGGPEGARTVQAGERIELASIQDAHGNRAIPFFSSLQALRRSISEQQHYLRMAARSLFEVTAGERLVLNPGLEHGKEFLPGEVRRMLSGGNPAEPGVEQIVVERPTQVLLGQPARYPEATVRLLSEIFAALPQVRAAYLGACSIPDEATPPHLLVGIDAGAAYEEVMRALSARAAELAAAAGDVVDCVPMDHPSAMQAYLATTQPFYRRGWAARLRSLVPFGGR